MSAIVSSLRDDAEGTTGGIEEAAAVTEDEFDLRQFSGVVLKADLDAIRTLAMTALCLIDLGELEAARLVIDEFQAAADRNWYRSMLEVRNFAAEIDAALAAAGDT